MEKEMIYLLIATYFCINCFLTGRRWRYRYVGTKGDDFCAFLIGFIFMLPYTIIEYFKSSNTE